LTGQKNPALPGSWENGIRLRLEGHPNRERWLKSVRAQTQVGRSIATRLIRERIPLESVVVDVGCAEGGIAIALQQAGFRAFGIDIDLRKLAVAPRRAKEEGVRPVFLRASACALPLVAHGVDAVVMENVIEHMPEWTVAVEEAARVLREPGRIILSLPNRLGLRTILSDPHFGVFGLTLLPRPLAAWLIRDVLKRAEVYDVYQMPSLRHVREVFRIHGIKVTLDDGLDRFLDKAREAPGKKGRLLRLLAEVSRTSSVLRLPYRIYRRFVSEVWILVGEKQSAIPP